MLKRLRDYINRRNEPFWSVMSDKVAKFNGEVNMVMQRDRMAIEKEAIERLKYGSDNPTAHEIEIMKRSRALKIGDEVDLIVPPKFPDNVNHPPHYNNGKAHCNCGRRIECIDITRHHNFNIGNAIKYLWRSELKGATVEDLRKAIWYIEDEIKSLAK